MKWADRTGYFEEMKDRKKLLVAFDMSVGKTAFLLGLIDHKIFVDGIKDILIITPKQVSLSTWQNEIKKWKNFRYMEKVVRLINGDEEKRLKILKDRTPINIDIISSSLTEWLYGYRVKSGKSTKHVKRDVSYDLIIVDECSQFKNPQSKRFKALYGLSRNKQLFLLSGTPFSNIQKDEKSKSYIQADELFYVFKLFDVYKKSMTQFRKDFCYTYGWSFDYYMKEEVYERLLKVLTRYSITQKLILDVELKEKPILVAVDKKKMQELKNEFILELGDDTEITAGTRAIMINKALQLGNGFLYDELGKAHYINEFKLEKMREIIRKYPNDNFIVFYNFKEDRRRIIEEFGNIVKEYSVENEMLWNDGKIKILLLSPFAEKYGLNLQYGGSKIIWYSLVWSAESYEQANKRLHRSGQKNDVDVFYLVADGGFDKYVYDKLVLKIETKDELLEVIKGGS